MSLFFDFGNTLFLINYSYMKYCLITKLLAIKYKIDTNCFFNIYFLNSKK